MKIKSVEIRVVELPLVRPFRTSFGTQLERELLLMKITTHEGTEGWAECVAMSEPLYSPEYTAGCQDIMERFLLPAIFEYGDIRAEEVAGVLKPFLSHQMSKATIETAILDAQLKLDGISFGSYLGSSKPEVDCGVSVGIANNIDALVEEVSQYIGEGYRRIKLKIEPGWDLEPVRVIRTMWPDIPLQVDANQAYTRNDTDLLKQLDPYNLLLIEQPLDEHDVLGHAMLSAAVNTPICLDESITSFEAARDALALKATTVINVKPGRVGGYLESVKIHDLCVENGIPVWCGGMLETGIGRAANVALASLPGFTLPGDTSASSRYFKRDLTTPFVMNDGRLRVPTAPGIGVDIDHDFIEEITTSRKIITAPVQ
ncbi:MAG: o-succinylbenzoate synthase [Streptomycetaceae bacterium]|nr:MAG: o-succinylbenzoate synthase [Streptomycetaceae bacterium]